MPIKKTSVKVYELRFFCDCGAAPEFIKKEGLIPHIKVTYICNNCNKHYELDKKYPYIIYEAEG